jgi:hypothetical protein
MFPIEKSPKISYKFFCEKCNYKCSKQSEINKHNSTNKHKILQNPTCDINISKPYICECGKNYKHSSTLYAHRKNCVDKKKSIKINEDIDYSIPGIDKDLIMLLIKENSELKHMMIEQQNIVLEIAKNGTYNNNTTNSHNKSFNLQFFLNETCKDAMNITDFVNSLQLQLSDLERVGELGYVEGISKIIINNLKDLDITLRPVHCTDKKRETIYVKDENKWEKDEEKKKMHKLVRKVADKNARMLPKFKERYPDYKKSSSNMSDQYNKILIESMGGPGENDYDKEEKIIKMVSKEIIVEKHSVIV